jgi:HEAT repeat protein
MIRFASCLALLSALFLWTGCAVTPERAAVKKADSLLDQGQVQAAMDVVENYLRRHPNSTALLRMRVIVLLRAERPELAAQALRNPSLSRALLPELLHHRDAIVRVNAAKLIADSPVSGDFHDLIHALDDPDPNVRRYSSQALGKLKNPEALKPLFRLLADDNWFVRAEAATALGEIGDPRSVGWLIQLLADDDGYVRYSATMALYELASDSSHPLLRRGLDSAGPKQRFGIAVALAKLKDPAALGPLTSAIHDTDADVRRQAAEALGECGQPEATNALTVLLKDPDPKVCRQAAESLQQLKSEKEK